MFLSCGSARHWEEKGHPSPWTLWHNRQHSPALLPGECKEHAASVHPAGHWRCSERALRWDGADGSAPLLSGWLRVNAAFFK